MISLTLVIDDVETLQSLFVEQLSKGRMFIPADWTGGGSPERGECQITLRHLEREHLLAALVVHVRTEEPGPGVGLQLVPLEPAGFTALRAFVGLGPDWEKPRVEDSFGLVGPFAESAFEPVAAGAAGAVAEADGSPEDDAESESRPDIKSLHDRIRHLTGAEQLRLAQTGTLAERTALERLYGPTVWETLLRSGRLTLPEVARIARKGSLPRPLVDLVAACAPWIASGEVQRALLSNPRSSSAVVMKVLSAMPRRELQMVPIQTAYPESVRQAAKRRLGQ